MFERFWVEVFCEFDPTGEQEVIIGRTPLEVSRWMSSYPSSMIVRSAVNCVSNTFLKPSRRSPATICPVTRLPGSIPLPRRSRREWPGRSAPPRPGRVGEFLEHRVGVVTLDDRTRWAHNCALAAVRAGDVAETAVEESGDNAPDAALRDVDRTHRLHVGAHRNAAAAQDALVGVPDDGREVVSQGRTFRVRTNCSPLLPGPLRWLAVRSSGSAHTTGILG